MRNYKKHRHGVVYLFALFLKGTIDKKNLISGLYSIEKDIDPNSDKSLKGLWFKFFKEDTVATTLRDLYCDIDDPKNATFVKECMQIAIDNPKGLEIHYS